MNADKKATEKKSGVQIGLLLKIDFVISFFCTDGIEIFQSFIGQTTIGWFSYFSIPSLWKKEKISIPHSIWHNQNYYTDDKNCKETQIKYNKAKWSHHEATYLACFVTETKLIK